MRSRLQRFACPKCYIVAGGRSNAGRLRLLITMSIFKIAKIKKRDGRIVDFDQKKITQAIFKAITATNQGDGKKSEKLSARVVGLLEQRFNKEEIPTVEQIQDIVEEVLISEGLVETAKAYILYREQRRKIREAMTVIDESVELVDKYIKELDWQIYENANMAYSLQGLNQYIISAIAKKYWLNKVYPKEIREAAINEDFHIHDMESISTYCCGWDLYDLLLRGFGGVPGKLQCYPPKHFKTALGQLVNFFFTLQGECYPDDTQVLTDLGWKYFYEINKEDKIFTLNIQTNEIELQAPIRFYKFDNKKELYNFKSKKLDLLVTPNHNMLVKQYYPGKKNYVTKFIKAKDFNPNTHWIPKYSFWKGRKEKYFFLPGIEVLQYRNFAKPDLNVFQTGFLSEMSNDFVEVFSLTQTKIITSAPMPIWKYEVKKIEPKKILMGNWLKFFGFYIAEGNSYARKRYHKNGTLYHEYLVRIFQNKGKIAEEFECVLKKLPFHYRKKGEGENKNKIVFEIGNKQLYEFLKQFGKGETKYIPHAIKNLSISHLKILFNWLMKGDGYVGNGNMEYSTKSKKLADDVQEIVLKLGWTANIQNRSKGEFKWHDVSVSRTKHFRFKKENIKKIKYCGKVYCLEVPNHTLYVRREGKACWCGNSAGAQAVSNFDTLLAPFIRYDKLSPVEVKQAIQEFLYNCMVPTRTGFQSLCWDELVVIKDKGKIIFEQIGQLIDKEFKRNSHRIIEKHPQSYAIENHDDYYVLSFDQKGKAVWARVNAFIRHRVPKNSEFVKIRTNRGEVKVSEAHSLFNFPKFDGAFNPQPRSVKNIKIAKNYRHLNPENHFIGLKSLENQGNKRELDLVEIIDEIPQLHKNVFVKINSTRTLKGIRQNILLEKQSFVPFYKEFGLKDRGVWEYWLSRKSIRYEIWRKYGNPKQEVKFKLKNSDIWYPRILEKKSLENFVKLCAWYITEGHTAISTPLYISQSPSKKLKEIIGVLKKLNALGQIAKNKSYSKKAEISGEVFKITGKGLLSELISRSCGYLSFNKVIPSFIFELSSECQEIFLEILLKGDASEYKNHWDFSTSSRKLSSSLSFLLAQNSHRFSVYVENTSKKNKNWRDKLITRIYKTDSNPGKIYFVNNFEARSCLNVEKFRYQKEYEYDISVDSPQENFIGGNGLLVFHNTPFLNVSIDIKPPEFLAKQPVLIGGKPQEETYEEFQEEMNIFNRFFYEVMMEGDATGRPFVFPIPTVSITKDFDWDNPNLNPLWEATAKYGVNYFSNFIQSDMKPEDFRSMCVTPDTQIIYKNTLGNIGKMPIRRIVEDFIKSGNLGEVLMNGEFVKIKNVLRLTNRVGYVLKITIENGETFRITPDHPSIIIKENKLIEVQSEKLKIGDEIPIAKNPYKGELGDFDLGRFVGLYIAEGYLTHQGATTGLSFNLEEQKYVDFVTQLVQKRFGAKTTLKIEKERKSLASIINDRAVGAIVKNYVRGEYSKTKRLNSRLFGMSFEFRKGVLIGILEGDGHISKIDSARNIQINSSNSGLIDDIGLLCRSLGINYTKQINLNNTHFGVKFTSYKLLLTNDFSEWLGKYFNRKSGKSRIYKNYKNFYGIKIKSIKKIPYTDQVYDFKTNNKEHLFQLANGVITHNCCRLRLSNKELYKRGGGLFGSQPLTGSIGVCTINMPRLGYLSATKKEFFERLEKIMDLAKESLEIKRKALENFMEKGLYPYSKYYLASVKKIRGSYFGNHFSTIGFLGMNEALLNFIGEDIGSEKGRKFTLEVMDFMREKLVKYQEQTGILYNLEATPAEGTSYRQAKIDREKYPDIITAGTKETAFYTNSAALPVNYTDDIFEALKLQDEILAKYTGGSVFHLFLGERITDVQAVKKLIKKIFENFHLPYITLTPTFSVCPIHGYLTGEHFNCPKCVIKQPCEVYSRIVGYLRPLSQWNLGKQQEYQERKEFKAPKI